MIGNKRILAVVPARGGSKGIPLKNIQTVNGRPMVALVGDVVSQIPEIDRAVVSTDHDEIARIAEESGVDAPFRRPEELSGDRISDYQVMSHALATMEDIDQIQYDIILMLQPTSPMRTAKHVTDCMEMLIKGNWDAVWSVSETDSKGHPLKQLTIDDNELAFYDPDGANIIARQQLTPVYHRNGVAYAFTRECLVNQKTILGKRTGAQVINETMANIDTPYDLLLADFMFAQKDSSDA
ncbi:MAG: acylneuraminate cytidylyltransferase family protein [Magnetovibrio sp.]|nr:acylneuraminate cytidylyltransferase family protein [Magnetovibrio sp.]